MSWTGIDGVHVWVRDQTLVVSSENLLEKVRDKGRLIYIKWSDNLPRQWIKVMAEVRRRRGEGDSGEADDQSPAEQKLQERSNSLTADSSDHVCYYLFTLLNL